MRKSTNWPLISLVRTLTDTVCVAMNLATARVLDADDIGDLEWMLKRIRHEGDTLVRHLARKVPTTWQDDSSDAEDSDA